MDRWCGPSSRKQFVRRGLTAKSAVKPSKSKFLSLVGANRNMLFDPAGSGPNSFLVSARPSDLLRVLTDASPRQRNRRREQAMLITRKSLMTGKLHTIEIPVTQAELDAYHSSGTCIQDFFPHLTPAEREFIKSGITAEEWATLADEDDEIEQSETEEPANER
jgi:hypothetical protein